VNLPEHIRNREADDDIRNQRKLLERGCITKNTTEKKKEEAMKCEKEIEAGESKTHEYTDHLNLLSIITIVSIVILWIVAVL